VIQKKQRLGVNPVNRHFSGFLYRHAVMRDIDDSLPQQAQCMDPSLRLRLDVDLARKQHQELAKTIAACPGITSVIELTSDGLADSVFIEDTAVVLGDTVLFTKPGALSRQPEVEKVRQTFRERFPHMQMKEMAHGGTLDGGDVLYTGKYLLYFSKSEVIHSFTLSN
jgi:dimethylargininase